MDDKYKRPKEDSEEVNNEEIDRLYHKFPQSETYDNSEKRSEDLSDYVFRDNRSEHSNNIKEEPPINTINENDNMGINENSYYKEKHMKKSKLKNNILTQLIAVALMSAILGGTTVGLMFMFGVPALKPYVDNKVSDVLKTNKFIKTNTMNNDPSFVKKIEIEKTDSPIVAVAEKTGVSVVGIRVTARSENSWPFGDAASQPQGSGIIIRNDGYIMTNNHVIEDAIKARSNELTKGSKIEVILPANIDKPYQATVIGRDERTDLAVLKIEASSLPAIELGNSDDVKVGELAIAIGNPGGLEYMGSVTAGIISGLNRIIPIDEGKDLRLIQTDAAINPGNSGGALVNSRGQLIGVNTAKIGGQGYEGLGFAIPVNKAKEITDSLIENKYVKGRPLLGISADYRYSEKVANEYDMPVGIWVAEVTFLSGAYNAGILKNDIIVEFQNKQVKDVDELNEIKNGYKPEDTVKVKLYRDGEYLEIKVKLSEDKG